MKTQINAGAVMVTGSASEEGRMAALYSKVTWRLLPLLLACYMVSYLDRVNIGFAKLQMQTDLDFNEAVYGLAAGIFFIGYALFEIPSNLLLVKVGARKTMVRILVLWGLTSIATMFVRNAQTLYVLRFMLGVFEAGFAPGMFFYLSYWYSASRLATVTAIVLMGAPVASLIGGPLSGWLLSAFHGTAGMQGWQWLFLIEGAPSVFLGIIAYFVLRDSPADAEWLNADEKARLISDVQGGQTEKHKSFGLALRDVRVYVLSIVSFCMICGIYTVSFWLPTILKEAGVTSVGQIGSYSAIPYAFTCVLMYFFSRRSDRSGERRKTSAWLLLAAAITLALAAFCSGSLWLSLLTITLTTALVWSALSLFWAIPADFLSGTAAAGGIALINTVGLLGGFFSPSIIGYVRTISGSFQGGLFAMAALQAFGAVLLFLIRGISPKTVRAH